MTNKTNISKRGIQATHTELRADLKLFFEAKSNMWHANNPDGKFPLNMAENNLSWDILNDKIEVIMKTQKVPDWVSNYTGIAGHDSFLEAVAQFMSTHLIGDEISAEHLVSSAGATAVMELASWVFCDSDDVAVFPAPCYPVYTQDINNKSAAVRHDLITHHDISEIKKGPALNIEYLNKTKQSIESNGQVFKMLVVTTPDNPTGAIYRPKQLEEIADWCIANEIHLLVNELYGLSIIDTQHPSINSDYEDHFQFSSFAKIMLHKQSPFCHLVYGLSKDMGVSGFRVGFLYTHNIQALEAYKNLNAPHMVSNFAQWIIQEILSDDEFCTNYIRRNKKLLTENYCDAIQTLKKCNIPYAPSRGSLFIWLELSHLMANNSQEAEHKLWFDIYEKTGILLTPGDGFGHTKRGQFRLVYSFIPKADFKEAMKKLKIYLTN